MVVLLLFVTMQFGLWFHARAVAASANASSRKNRSDCSIVMPRVWSPMAERYRAFRSSAFVS